MAGYRPFVYAFNHSLRALHDIDVPLRESSDLGLLFHRNDPKPIIATHRGEISERKPDIVLVSLDTARRGLDDGDIGCWDDFALKTAGNSPQLDFQWEGPYSVAELKRVKSKLSPPPPEYTINPVKSILPQPLPCSAYEAFEDRPTWEESTQHSDKVMLKPTIGAAPSKPIDEQLPSSINCSFSAQFRRSERLSSHPNHSHEVRSASHNSSGRKRKGEQGAGSSSTKRARTEPLTSRRRPAMLQSALYAAERMSHAVWIAHTINLVIIGEPLRTIVFMFHNYVLTRAF